MLLVPALKLFTGKPIIYDVHESYADFIKLKRYLPVWLRYPLARGFSWLEPLLARLCDGLIFADDQIAVSFQSLKLPKTTLFNFPACKFIKDASRAEYVSGKKDPVILHLGSQEKSRGTLVMLAAFQQILEAMPAAQLLLVGPFHPASHRQEVQSEINRLKLEKSVRIMGKVPFSDVAYFLQQSAIGWIALKDVPKYQKNIPTKLFEYMAAGLPIVSSDLIPSRPYIKNGENGYLVTPDDPTQLAQATLNILHNPSRAQYMSKMNRDRVRSTYNWNEMEKRLLTFYQTVLDKA